MPPDIELVQRSASGDRNAFGELVRRYQSLVCAVTLSRTGDRARSEDLAQETFVTAWKQLARLERPEAFRPWLCGIARNHCRHAARRASATPGTPPPPEEGPHQGADGVADPTPDPSETAQRTDDAEFVWNALRSLPEPYREPLVLYYREDRSVEAVSALLDLTPETVRQRLVRGRRLLRREIERRLASALERSGPASGFAIAVLAALPALTPASAAAAAVLGKGSGIGSSVSAGALAATLLGPALGILGSWIGIRTALRAARSEAERREIRRFGWFLAGLIATFALALGLVVRHALQPETPPARTAILAVTVAVLYGAALATLIVLGNRRLNRTRPASPARFDEPSSRGPDRPPEFRTSGTFLGLPWLVIRWSNPVPGRGRLTAAVAWIAIGPVAISPLAAFGTVAVAPVAFGVVPVGLVAAGALAIGGFAFGGGTIGVIAAGGLALGLWAFGGAAVGWFVAFGGAAVSRHIALGGAAAAPHANDALAREWLAAHETVRWLLLDAPRTPWSPLFWIAFAAVLFVVPRIASRIAGRMPAPPDRAGWIVQCPKCGRAKALPATGGLRLAASSYRKRTLGFCTRCRRFRWVVIRFWDPGENGENGRAVPR